MYGPPKMARQTLAVALVLVVVAGCGGGMSEAQVRKIAAEWFSTSETAAGQVVRKVTTTAPAKASMGGIDGWEIQVSGTEDSTGAVKSVFLFVDGSTGKVTEMASASE
jgi:hypothetical protein